MEKILVILDLDNTLLDSKKRISNYNSKILNLSKNLSDKDVKILLNTSRSYVRTLPYLEESHADYINCFNGNLLIDKLGNVLYENYIPKEKTKYILENIMKFTNNLVVETKYSSFCLTTEEQQLFDSKLSDINYMQNLDSYKILCKVNDSFTKTIKEFINSIDLSYSICIETGYIRIQPKASDKWNTIEKFIGNEDIKTISFGDDITDLKTLSNSSLGIKMKNSNESLNCIDFTTLSNDDDGIGIFLKNYFNINIFEKTNPNLQILDCSLRDGGHLNKSRFGKNTIKSFVSKLAQSNVDIIELGFLQDTVYDPDVAIYPTVEKAEEFLKDIDLKDSKVSLLTQVDKFDISNLTPRNGNVSLIRVSFHNVYVNEAIEYCKEVMNKGYECAINPINFSSYTLDETIELIKKVNELKPNIFSIVDTFGMYVCSDFNNKISLLLQLLNSNITLGLHLHDNLSLAFSSAQNFIKKTSNYPTIIIDTSVKGLGRAPGNLKTELLMYYANTYVFKYPKYNLDYIYSIMENEINNLSKTLNWDQDFAYAISAFEKLHRTYAEYFMDKGFDLKTINKLIKQIPDKNKGRYNEDIAEILIKYI